MLLETPGQGLTSAEAARRLASVGPNALPERRVNPLLRLLTYFWGPIPWMIEAAAALSAAARHWADFVVIVALLLFNAVVGFWQERQAGNAVDALRAKLALTARVLRDGTWRTLPAADVVPDDIVRVRLGDVIPADVKLLEGAYLSVDQSALTGESLPVEKHAGDVAYSGSVAKVGEMVAVVTATGRDTYFGKTAKLVAAARPTSHFQRAVLRIGDFLIYLSVGLVGLLLAVQLRRGAPWFELVQFALILTVASIPVAMPAVLSVTMAAGALALSKMKAIVARLEAVEEMAGIDVLCSDKTGTLTVNRLTLGEPFALDGVTKQEVVTCAALASKAEDRDAIDDAVIGGLPDQRAIDAHERLAFVPFDPMSKRTEAKVRDPSGRVFSVTKGAPQVVVALADLSPAAKGAVEAQVEKLAGAGYRTLGVARSDDGRTWRFLGLLPLYDPPRDDSAETIARARAHGIEIKMLTGDNVAIAREIARRVGLGTNIVPAERALEGVDGDVAPEVERRVEQADGYAQVFPEHKYRLIKVLQGEGHIVGMTGDGVNDAPSLKQADVGIAVSGATDAARAAAALVLTAPGLAVIVDAVETARRIFERMNSYATYRIAETMRIMIFVVLAMIAFNIYPITAIMIILLAFLNDIPIMTIAYDNTWLDPRPVRWDMPRVVTAASAMGLTGVFGSFLMLCVAMFGLHLDTVVVQTFIFLKMAVSGHLTLFVARTRHGFLGRPYPAPVMIWAAVSTKVLATVLAVYGFGLIAPLGWANAGIVWLYCLAWVFLTDWAKLGAYAWVRRMRGAAQVTTSG